MMFWNSFPRVYKSGRHCRHHHSCGKWHPESGRGQLFAAVSRIEIRDCIAEEVPTESGRIPPTKVSIYIWYKLFCADGFVYKRNSPDKRPVTEAKVNEVGARQLSMHACM